MSQPKTVPILRRMAGLVAALLLAAGLAATTGTTPAGAADPQPDAVSVPGDFGTEVGCPGDWQPDCPQVQLTRRGNDDVWTTTLQLAGRQVPVQGGAEQQLGRQLRRRRGCRWPEHRPHRAGRRQGGHLLLRQRHPLGHRHRQHHIVTAAGSFQSELGCPADWSPDCLRSWLEDPDGDGTYTFTTTAIPAGSYQVKAAVGLSWDVNYGAGGVPGGPNIAFTVPAAGDAGHLQLRRGLPRAHRASRHRPPSIKAAEGATG